MSNMPYVNISMFICVIAGMVYLMYKQTKQDKQIMAIVSHVKSTSAPRPPQHTQSQNPYGMSPSMQRTRPPPPSPARSMAAPPSGAPIHPSYDPSSVSSGQHSVTYNPNPPPMNSSIMAQLPSGGLRGSDI